MRYTKPSVGRPAANTELCGWNIPRATAKRVRREARARGLKPGAFVHQAVNEYLDHILPTIEPLTFARPNSYRD
jgi:hypothetical protein